MSFRRSASLFRVPIHTHSQGGSMRFLLTSAGIKNASISDALVDLLGKPIAESSALCVPTAAYGHPLKPGVAWKFISGREQNPNVRIGLEDPGRAGAHRTAQHRRRAMGPLGPADRCPAGGRWRCPVSEPLDAAVRAGGPLAVAARDGLRGIERREHGDDPAHRGGLRLLEAARRRRRGARNRRFLDLSARGSRGPAGQFAWPTQRSGRPGSQVRRMRSTTRPPSKSPTAPSKSSPRGTGGCSRPRS